MIIGVPREIKANEDRVAITPGGVDILKRAGHQVCIEKDAGLASGITDEMFVKAGAEILPGAADVWGKAEMIMKVKEPLPEEFGFFRKGMILFTYLHLASARPLTEALLSSGVAGVAYETIETRDGELPLLKPMSEVAGKMSVQVGVYFLQQANGGKGVLIGGVPGVPAGKVVIIGTGTVGTSALKIAVGLGAQVTIVGRNLERLRYLDDLYGGRICTLASTPYNIAHAVAEADLLVSCVLETGAKAPKMVSEEMVKSMAPGSVIVDVAIDQGGSVATIDHSTTHDKPVYLKHGVLHYAVANMPGAVARTSTYALTNATLPYALKLAQEGLTKAIHRDPALAAGVNTLDGVLTCEPVGKAFDLPTRPVTELI